MIWAGGGSLAGGHNELEMTGWIREKGKKQMYMDVSQEFKLDSS